MDERLEGWSTDPFGRHQMRWMSDGMPTDLVRDGNTESHELPPVESRPWSLDWSNEPIHSLLPQDWTGSETAERQTLLAQAEAEWFRFPNFPGNHLLYQKTSWNSWAWRNGTTGEIEMTSHRRLLEITGDARFGPQPKSISHQGRTYGWQRVGRRKVLAKDRNWDLIDMKTASPLLRKNGWHFNGTASTEIQLGQTVYSFPVIGQHPYVVMAAVDGTGKPILEYRSVWYSILNVVEHRDVTYKKSKTEIVIPPESLTIPGIYLLAAVTSRLIIDFLATPHSGA